MILGDGLFRKPRTGIWRTLTAHKNEDVAVDMTASFYVGDAAGRDKDWAPKRKKDFSSADRLFALNLGLTFQTPEEFFLAQKATTKFTMPEFDPTTVATDLPLLEPESAELMAKGQEVGLCSF